MSSLPGQKRQKNAAPWFQECHIFLAYAGGCSRAFHRGKEMSLVTGKGCHLQLRQIIQRGRLLVCHPCDLFLPSIQHKDFQGYISSE